MDFVTINVGQNKLEVSKQVFEQDQHRLTNFPSLRFGIVHLNGEQIIYEVTVLFRIYRNSVAHGIDHLVIPTRDYIFAPSFAAITQAVNFIHSSWLLLLGAVNQSKFLTYLQMKILQANDGALTNFEVLDFLRKRGASQDPTRVICSVAQSEFKVYDYLVQSPACNQTRECIYEFLKRCEEYNLAKAEKLNIINLRPSSAVEIDPIIEECDKRMEGETVEKLVEMVVQVLPPPPNSLEPEEVKNEE
ncbi:hypothetical protein NE237_008320 [Protea cynaroides]|uniref:DNA-directed RNA polymerase III subunit RPC9 n=1 Tax=Protea cynaroides TaxID=273540 RepID=A0A9Q0KVK0_9MAGN|nr:hypothetical protein NE237_008320 [Protea cynaroides]